MSRFKSVIFCTLLLSVFAISCTNADTPQSEYGADADYYMGLRSLESNDTETAMRLFRQAAKKGSPAVVRRAQEELTHLGSVTERIQNCKALYTSYNDEDALTVLCAELVNDREYADVIKYTQDVDVATCDTQLAYYRCLSLYQKKDSRFAHEFFTWCTARPFTEEQNNLLQTIEAADPVIQFRALVFNREDGNAYLKAKEILAEPKKLLPQIASDIGKAFMRGSTQFASNAALLDSVVNDVPKNCAFYIWFYAGRLYEKNGSSASRIKDRLSHAMQSANDEGQFDNACWYYLNAALKSSAAEAVEEIEQYRTQWHDPFYYDDFFDTLSVRLISEHLWKQYYRVATLIDGYASDETVAKFSYVSARFIQQGFISFNEPTEPIVMTLLTRALRSGSDFYYRLLAASSLGLSNEEVEKLILSYGNKTERSVNADYETLMNGYADFGLSEYIYAQWQQYDAYLSQDCIVRLAGFLRDCAEKANGHANQYYEQSIRMASRRLVYPESQPSQELLSLAYPTDYSDSVSQAAKRFELSEYMLYALIRSESFFAPAVASHANAIGLTQLMEATAADIARKLRMQDYNLEDPDTNILFGAFYLEEMLRRIEDAPVLGFFAYNGGISRVRSWKKSAALEFSPKKLSNDLFLEALPYAETREYGRKLTAASAIYGWLYQNEQPLQIVDSLLGLSK